ncbi:hypothetical protein [Nonomuraea dietziae]
MMHRGRAAAGQCPLLMLPMLLARTAIIWFSPVVPAGLRPGGAS